MAEDDKDGMRREIGQMNDKVKLIENEQEQVSDRCC